MTLFDRLTSAVTDIATLEQFLAHNAEELVDWFGKMPHEELRTLQGTLKKMVLFNLKTLQGLPQTPGNLAFLAMLLEKAEQLAEIAVFRHLYNHIQTTSFDIGSRLQAAARFLNIPNSTDEYTALYEDIYPLLETAYLEEEDTPDKVLFTMLNYYIQVIENCGEFNPDAPKLIQAKLSASLKNDEYSFLNCPLILDVLQTDLKDAEAAAIHIRALLDIYLDRRLPVLTAVEGMLIEEDTDYSSLLQDVPPDFTAIREISVRKHQANEQGQAFFTGLQRGVKILDDERELYAYMVGMGKMHAAKLESAFDKIDFATIRGPVHIVDWGCGQGMGTMVLLDYLKNAGLELDIHNVTLIEPSKIAIKRGSLHTLKYDESVGLLTINKTIDGLSPDEFKKVDGTVIHIFANILDIDAISLKPLTELIKSNFPGQNLFVCTSPYVNGIKTNRLDVFLTSFKGHHLSVLMRKDNPKGSWINNWSRVVRVFTASF